MSSIDCDALSLLSLGGVNLVGPLAKCEGACGPLEELMSPLKTANSSFRCLGGTLGGWGGECDLSLTLGDCNFAGSNSSLETKSEQDEEMVDFLGLGRGLS